MIPIVLSMSAVILIAVDTMSNTKQTKLIDDPERDVH